MRVLTIVHEADAGPGVFADVLTGAGAEVELWLPAEQTRVPSDPAAYDAVLSFGGSAHPHQDDRFPWIVTERALLAGALAADVPVLGICLGSELLAECAGVRAHHLAHPEIGWCEVRLTQDGAEDPLLGPIGETFEALEWHSYAVEAPPGATALARSDSCLQAFRIGARAWGLQFHAEVTAEDFQHWLDNHTLDEDAVREGIDPVAIARETSPRLAEWHELGQGICARFLDVVAAR